MPNGAWNIRLAVVHDARAIAEVHVASWKSTYRGIFADAILRNSRKTGTSRPREFLTLFRGTNVPFALLKELAQNGHVEAARIPDLVSRHECTLCAFK
jgi:hypothetical protein